MSLSDTVTGLLKSVGELYRELATTSVRYDALRHSTETTLLRFERLLDQHAQRVQVLHDEHVREKAGLEAQIQGLEGRLMALSEKALHAVVHEAAREVVRESVGVGEAVMVREKEER